MKRTKKDWASTQFVNSFDAAELVFPQASVIGLALYDSTAAPGEPGHRDHPFQFRMTAPLARSIAKALLELADELDGKGQRRQ